MFRTLGSLSPWIDEVEFIEEAMVWYGFSLDMSTALFLAISTNFRNLKSAELNGSCVWLCSFVTTLSSIILHVLRQLDVFSARAPPQLVVGIVIIKKKLLVNKSIFSLWCLYKVWLGLRNAGLGVCIQSSVRSKEKMDFSHCTENYIHCLKYHRHQKM